LSVLIRRDCEKQSQSRILFGEDHWKSRIHLKNSDSLYYCILNVFVILSDFICLRPYILFEVMCLCIVNLKDVVYLSFISLFRPFINKNGSIIYLNHLKKRTKLLKIKKIQFLFTQKSCFKNRRGDVMSIKYN
jgi:hypothetical protein